MQAEWTFLWVKSMPRLILCCGTANLQFSAIAISSRLELKSLKVVGKNNRLASIIKLRKRSSAIFRRVTTLIRGRPNIKGGTVYCCFRLKFSVKTYVLRKFFLWWIGMPAKKSFDWHHSEIQQHSITRCSILRHCVYCMVYCGVLRAVPRIPLSVPRNSTGGSPRSRNSCCLRTHFETTTARPDKNVAPLTCCVCLTLTCEFGCLMSLTVWRPLCSQEGYDRCSSSNTLAKLFATPQTDPEQTDQDVFSLSDSKWHLKFRDDSHLQTEKTGDSLVNVKLIICHQANLR